MQARTTYDDASAPLADVTRGIARIGLGLLFLQHGLQKIFGMFGGQPVELTSLMGVAGMIELVGSALIILGLFARPVAAILALEMLGAYFMAHMPKGGLPVQNGGELPLLFAVAFIFIAGHGAGAFSLDRLLTRRRPTSVREDAVTRGSRAA